MIKLSQEAFLAVVKHAPLVSIDVILRDEDQRVLLGQRQNKPAQGYWFVPGGRIRKNETRENAFRRITGQELGFQLELENARFKGVYEHLYDDNFSGTDGIGTHYVVLAYEYALESTFPLQADNQHAELRWMTVEELLSNGQVHPYTKQYFSNL